MLGAEYLRKTSRRSEQVDTKVKYTEIARDKVFPEGGGGNYGETSGGFDALGFGTLMYAR